jgi:hypothetical protein
MADNHMTESTSEGKTSLSRAASALLGAQENDTEKNRAADNSASAVSPANVPLAMAVMMFLWRSLQRASECIDTHFKGRSSKP